MCRYIYGWLTSEGRRKFPLAAKVKYFHYNSLSFSLCHAESAKFWRYRKCHGAEFLAENRGQVYTFLNVPPPHFENVAEKFSDVQKIFSKAIQ